MFGGAALVNAQDQGQTREDQTQTMDQHEDGQQISVSELPDAVSSKLESQDYAAWTVGDVYKKTDESQNEIYTVELRQGADTKKVRFDKDGNKLDKGMKDDKSDRSQYRGADEDATQSGSSSSQDATDQTDNSGSQTETP